MTKCAPRGKPACAHPHRHGSTPRPRRSPPRTGSRRHCAVPFRSSGPSKTGGVGWLTRRVNDPVADANRNVPVALGREAEDFERVVGVEGRAVGAHREPRARHVLPAEGPEGANGARVDRVLRQHGHAVLAFEGPEAVGIPGPLERPRLRLPTTPSPSRSSPVARPVFDGAMKLNGQAPPRWFSTNARSLPAP